VVAVIGFLETAFFAVVTDGLHRPATFVGVLISVQGIGAVAGGLSAAPIMRRLSETRLTALGILTIAIGSAICVVPAYVQGVAPMVVVVVAAVVVGAGLPWMIVGADTLLQRRTPLSLQVRVNSAFGLLFGGFQTASIGLGALLIGAFGYVPSLLAMGVVGVSVAGYLLSRPKLEFVIEAGGLQGS